MNKQLRELIGRATTRVNMGAGIITSVLPEVIRIQLARVLGPYLNQPQAPAQQQGAESCPFGGSAGATQAPADADVCPFTGKRASEARAEETPAPVAKEAAAKPAPAPAKKAEAKKPAAKKPAAKKAAATKPAPKKAAAKKPAAKKAPAKSAKKKSDIAVADLTLAELKKLTRKELYSIAQELEITGRKDMRKAELFDAIQKELKL